MPPGQQLRAMPLLLSTVALTLLGCKKDENQLTVQQAAPMWGKLEDHLELSDSKGQPALVQLRKRTATKKPFRPYSGAKEAAVERAERLLRRIEEPGRSLALLEPPVDWAADPDDNRNAHFQRNAFRPLRPLVAGHIATGNARYLEHLMKVMLDWMDYNLIQQRKNPMKWYDMSTGLRAVVLAYLIEQQLKAPVSDENKLTQLVWVAKQHCNVLSDPRLFTEGNHGMYMMLGLKALVSVVPDLRGAAKYSAYADSKMRHLLETRYSKEGFHLEHSPEYHMVTTRSVQWIVDTGLFDGTRGVQEMLARARSVAYQLVHPNGDRVLIGDSSRAVFSLRGEDTEHRLFIDSEGERGTPPPQAGLQAHPDAGYLFFRSPFEEKPFTQHSYLFFAPGYHSHHHKHADHLSFEWSEAGYPILVDSGKFDYSRDRWREFFVSTRAGNAVEVDGQDYSTRSKKPWGGGVSASGSAGPLQFMQARVRHVMQDEQQSWDLKQLRTLVLLPRQWLCVVDLMQPVKPPEQPHEYRQWFHFHEAFTVRKQPDHFVARLENGPIVHARSLAPERATLELAHGQQKPRIQGWLSSEHRKKTKRASIAFRAEGGAVLFVTLFSLQGTPRAARVVQDGDGVEVSFTTRRSHRFVVKAGSISRH